MKSAYEKLYLLILDDFESKYSHLRNKGIKISDLRKQSKDFKKVKTGTQFIKELHKKLSQFKDLHIAISTPYKKAKKKRFVKKMEKNFDEKILKKYFKKFIFENEVVKIAKDKKTIYIFTKTWSGRKSKEIDEACHFFDKQLKTKKFDKIIFDVRINTGGEARLANKYLKLLIKKDKKVNIYKFKDTFNTIPELEKTITVSIKGTYGFNGKIIALTGQKSCSATETFLWGIKEIGGILIGDRTYGSSGNPREYRYGNLKVLIPSRINYNIKNKIIEDNPIQPDIKIPSSKSIVKGKDLVLEKALSL